MEEENKSAVNRKKQIIEIVDTLLFTLIIVCSICFSVTLLFEKLYFNRFFVNGQSMYPTLNLHAKDSNGVEYGKYYRSLENGSHDIDYGIYDCHDSVKRNIKRFDIVVCKYSDDDNYDKIKRVIVLPGETFYITRSSVNEENGLLYIKNKKTGKFDFVSQPIDSEFIHEGSYPIEYASGYTLADDEYFILGDNRAHSSDSRSNGPIKYNLIDGKVIALVASCSIKKENGKLSPINVSYYWPRFF